MANSLEDLLESIQILHEFKEEDIKKPKPEVMRVFYEKMLKIFLHYDKNTPIAFSAIQVLSNWGAHEEAIIELTFLRSLSKLMKIIGVHDFQYKDVYEPEYRKTKRILYRIVNLAAFREIRVNKLIELQEGSTELMNRKTKVVHNESKIFARLDMLRKEKSHRDSEYDGLEQTYQQQHQEINQYNIDQANLRHEIQQIKDDNEKLEIKNEELITKTDETKQEISLLEDLVIKSPEKIKKNLEDKTLKIKQEKEKIHSIEKDNSLLLSKYEKLEKMSKDIKKILGILSQCSQENEVYKKIKQRSKVSQKKVQDYQKLSKDLDIQLVNLHQAISSTDSSMLKNQEIFKNNKKEFHLSLKQIEAERILLEREKAEVMKKVDENQIIINEIENEMSILERSYKIENQSIIDAFKALTDAMKQYHNIFYKIIEDPPNPLSGDITKLK
ncbi:hypothetical protein CYY_004364 [Polysphondylium violaceum]|uniref:Kinetochore protein Nuf2 N-terminal domain-containing protein n=1 Tax=Polysphondylium violaceum TaxID=133409 RepID=A0A8J4PTH0_9MYCE|nr:hypothetical protein CYY_004364 [Polysphondylium violaceum]